MIHAEISIYPIGTNTTSASFYIAKAVEVAKGIEGLTYMVTPMGTILEAKGIDVILDAIQQMTRAVHNLGVNRVEVIVKIDSRLDKQASLQEKLDSVNKHL